MSENKIKIVVYTDSDDIVSVTEPLLSFPSKLISFKVFVSDTINLEYSALTVVYLTQIHSDLFGSVVVEKDELKDKIVLVVESREDFISGMISKMGFKNTFYLPTNKQNYDNYIIDHIRNRIVQLNKSEGYKHHRRSDDPFSQIIGNSNELKKVVKKAKRIASNRSMNILLNGETGVGKGLFAKAIHEYGNPPDTPFLEINCSEIPETLLESELFGHEKGSFTDAHKTKTGLFEMANYGTIFLDEIGELSLNIQSKLLRVIEKKLIRRVGSVEDIPVDTRIITATNKDLSVLVEQKKFRSDLFFRLDVISLDIPPLSERIGDAVAIARYYFDEFSHKYGVEINSIEKECLEFIDNYEWPGNARELIHTIERAVILFDGGVFKLKDIESQVRKFNGAKKLKTKSEQTNSNIINMHVNFEETDLKMLSSSYAKKVIDKVQGNKSKAASFLNISRPTLDSLLKIS